MRAHELHHYTKGVKDRGFAGAIATDNGGHIRLEVDLQFADTENFPICRFVNRIVDITAKNP